MYFLILLLPLLSFLTNFLLGRWLGQKYSLFFSMQFIFFTFLLSLYFFYEVILSGTVVSIILYNWINLGLFDITFGLYFDFLTSAMLLIITSISFLVHFYSLGYMSHDPYILRFVSYLSLFTFFMIFLVSADNFFQLFLGWEGVGLCSYLLINFWYTRILANKAALKAMIVNRISDVFFMLGIVLVFLTFRTTDFMVIFNLAELAWVQKTSFLGFYFNILDLICFFFFIGAVGKSAQLGLHTWLPDAMEGPTPVSALLHAATMVTAGVFLILRSSPLFEFSPNVLLFVSIIGAFTALFSALVGVFQYDVKKLIAFSTCSQLGYMFFTCGLSVYHVALFHLFNHAFFKALLFLAAGSIIHALFDEQDMRRMGALLNFIPFTYFVIFVASLSIMGFPFLTGFYSKDLLLEFAHIRFVVDGLFIYSLGILTAFFTAVYSLKLLIFVFFHSTNIFRVGIEAKEDSFYLFIPLFILGFSSIFVGYIFCDIFVGFGFTFLLDALFFFPLDNSFIEMELLSPLVKNVPFIFSLIGTLMGFLIFIVSEKFLNKFTLLQDLNLLSFLVNIKRFFFFFGFFNVIYNNFFVWFYSLSYYNYNRLIDKGILEWWGPYGFYLFFRHMSVKLLSLQPYQLSLILGWMFIFFVAFWFFTLLYLKSSLFGLFLFSNSGLLIISLLFIFFTFKVI